MKQSFKNSRLNFQFEDEEIMAGFKFKMQYLGCGEELKLGGSDHEIANVIHDIHQLYAGRNTKLSKARTVVVFVDTEKINIFDENEDEILLTFPLVYVKDVTTCLDQVPYSKTCVLVAKQYNEPLYKAFVFYSKSTSRAAEFYQFTTSAFQLGYKRIETLAGSLDSQSTVDDEIFEASSSTPSADIRKANSHLEIAKNEAKAYLDEEDGDSDSVHEFGKNFPESQKLLKSGTEILQLKGKSQRKKPQQQTVTVRLSSSLSTSSSFETQEKREIKFNLNLGDENNNQNSSKIGVFMDTVGQSSRVLTPHWFRNSYRKFRKISGQRPDCKNTRNTQDV